MMSMTMMMQMTFYWGKKVTILFDFWHVDTVRWYVVSLLVVFVFAMLHQLLAGLRSAFAARPARGSKGATSVEDGDHRTPSTAFAGRKSCLRKAAEASLFGVSVGLGYLLMLAAMSFNGGVFLAIVLGLAVGNFLFCNNGPRGGGDIACGEM